MKIPVLPSLVSFRSAASVIVVAAATDVSACSGDEGAANPGDGGSTTEGGATGGRSAGGASSTGGRNTGGRGSGGRASGGTTTTDGSTDDGASGSDGSSTGGSGSGGTPGTGGTLETGGATTGGTPATGGNGPTDSGVDASSGGSGSGGASTGGSTGCPHTDASIGFRCNGFAGIETYYQVSNHRLWVHANVAPLAVSGRFHIEYRNANDGLTHCTSGAIATQNGVPYIDWLEPDPVDRFRILALELVDVCGQAYSFTVENGNDCDAVELSLVSDASATWASSCVNAGAGPCATLTSCD